MKDNIIAVPLLVITVIVALVAAVSLFGGAKDEKNKQVGPEAIDVTLEFYNTWLDAKRSTTTIDFVAFLATSSNLTDELRTQLQTNLTATPDPVLCMAVLPARIGVKPIFELATTSEYMVVGRGGVKTPESALVSLVNIEGFWKISNITCSAGETTPEREFTFEQRGSLLKSVPPPLDANYWHLVFTENNEPGHTMALMFTASSSCTYADGTERGCDTTLFTEGQEAFIQGTASESGASVLYMKLY
jgi:hypothetical protein